jgi:hypothetical protein
MKIKLKDFKKLIKEAMFDEISMDSINSDDVMNASQTTQPIFDTSPEALLMHKLFAASDLKEKFAGFSAEEIAEKLGVADDSRMIPLIKNLLGSRMYDKI